MNPELLHECTHLIFSVNRIASPNTSSGCATRHATRSIVAPISTGSSVRTITSHVSGVATNATNNIGGKVALLRAVVLAMTDLTTYGC